MLRSAFQAKGRQEKGNWKWSFGRNGKNRKRPSRESNPWPQQTRLISTIEPPRISLPFGLSLKVSSDTIIGWGATLILKLVKMKLFRASQSSVVHIEEVLTSNQSPVWPAKIFQRFIDRVVCKLCVSQSFRHQSTSCAKNHTKAVLCSDISIVSCRTTLWDVAT